MTIYDMAEWMFLTMSVDDDDVYCDSNFIICLEQKFPPSEHEVSICLKHGDCSSLILELVVEGKSGQIINDFDS